MRNVFKEAYEELVRMGEEAPGVAVYVYGLLISISVMILFAIIRLVNDNL